MREKRTYKNLENNIGILQRAIAESKRVRDALRESERKFRILADSTPGAVMIYQDDRWIFVNKEAENLTGYSASELLSKNFWDIVHPDYRELVRIRGQRRQNGDDIKSGFELKTVAKNGREKWVWVVGASVMINGRHAGVVSATDITGHKQRDEALAKIMERLEIISRTASELLFSTDPRKIIDALCERIMDHLNCHVFLNYLVNDERNCLELNACAGIPPDTAEKIRFIAYGKAVCGYVAQTGLRFIADDIPATPDVRTDLLNSFGIRAYVCHPLLARGKVIGTLSFGTRSCIRFTVEDISLMKTIADHVAMAMERINVFKLARAHAKELDIRVKERTRQLKRQADLLDLSHDAIIVCDINGRVIFWSTGAENTYGFQKQEAIGKYVYQLLQPESKTPLKSILTEVEKKGQWEGEFIHTCKNGTKITTHCRWALRVDENTRSMEIMEVNRDITFRKRAEEALKTAYSYNRSLFEASIDPLVTINPQGRISDANAATEHITGCSRDELIGTDFSDYFTNPERARHGYQLVFEKGIVRDYELEIRRSDGDLIPVLYNASIYSDESGRALGVFAAARDIAERRRLEDQLRQAQKMEAIGTLAGGIAHDFNNILAAIIGFSEMIEEDLPESSLSLNHIRNVLRAAGRGQDLVKQILAFSRKTAYSRNILPVAPLIEETVALPKASLPSTIEIKLNCKAVNDTIFASPVEVQQILINLATNAAFAMRESGGTLKIDVDEIYIQRRSPLFKIDVKPGNYIQLTVSDTGSGMTRDIMDRIFDPFFTTKNVGEGTGMGLAVVYGIMQSLHGTVAVNSKPGKGSSFKINFPHVPAVKRPDEFEPSLVQGGTESILFVDDEELLIEWGGTFLQRLGYSVTAVRDGSKALHIFKEAPARFDLVITDQTMPEITGSRLAIEILNIRPDIPVILCTGHSNIISPDKAKEIGIKQYLMKPITRKDLAKTVRMVLDEAKN